MTVKIRDKELYDTYKYTMAAVANRGLTLTDTLKVLSDYIILKDSTRDHDGDISTIIKAIIDGEPVELVEPKFLLYIPVPSNNYDPWDCMQMLHGVYDFSRTSSEASISAELYSANEYRFAQSEVDELKKKYPYIKTKEVEE